MERILFLYAKLNPGQSYVQGMNEIIGPPYYTFASDPNVDFQSELWDSDIIMFLFTTKPNFLIENRALINLELTRSI